MKTPNTPLTPTQTADKDLGTCGSTATIVDNHTPRQVTLPVSFHDCDTLEDYTAYSIEDCKDSTDKSIFKEVQRSNDVITMGKTIGWPAKVIMSLRGQ